MLAYSLTLCRDLGSSRDKLESSARRSDAGSEAEEKGWWDDEDTEAPWMTQATRLMPKSTIVLWQFTP